MKIHWIFRVVSLFNYQGSKRNLRFRYNRLTSGCLCCSRSDSFILSQLIFIVKHFFTFFKKIFTNLQRQIVWIVLTFRSFEAALLCYHSVCGLSTPFLKDFLNCCWPCFQHRFVESEVHSSTLPAFCQHLFLKIFKFSELFFHFKLLVVYSLTNSTRCCFFL